MSFRKYGIFNLSDAVGILHMKRSKKELKKIIELEYSEKEQEQV